MNNLADLSYAVSTLNYTTVPLIQETLYNLALHIGEYKYSARSNDFNGWMMCDGRSLSQSNFYALYDVIGTTFGSADSNSFNLPDFRGRALAMMGHGSNLTNRPQGASIGEEVHTLTVTEIPGHIHTVTDPGHTHTQSTYNNDYNNNGGTPPGFGQDAPSTQPVTWNNISGSTTGVSINSTGGGQAHNNMQPTLFGGNVFIYTGYILIGGSNMIG